MKKIRLISMVIFFFLFMLTSGIVVNAVDEDNGVDLLRGRWELNWIFTGVETDPPPPLQLFINDLSMSDFKVDTYVAGGCMRSPETNAFMPLSLSAVDNLDGTYDVTIYSTVVPPDTEPYVIRFRGNISFNNLGKVPDDYGEGGFTTEFGTGTWTGVHHDRRRTKCPIGDLGDYVQADVRLQQDVAYNPPQPQMVFEMYTPVVSTAMQVELPDGSTRIVGQFTDIFSPDVDFIGRFRYFEDYEGESPLIGATYRFRLLDVIGNPIPGTESTDVYWRCNQEAPQNLSAVGNYGSDVNLSWNPVPVVFEEFDPQLQGPESGFHMPYQLGISSPFEGDETEFGALAYSESHIIPWGYFEPGSEGSPDGFNFGQPLMNFGPGMYRIEVASWNIPDVDQGGNQMECMVFDSSESLYMEISDENYSFIKSGTISGLVTSSGGEPLSGVWVDACEFDNEDDPFCQSASTNEDGEYRITNLLPGDYRVQVWGDQRGWIDEFWQETPFQDEAIAVPVGPGAETPGINFTMEEGGSISGNVSDTDGSLSDVHVDACTWDDTFCNGAETDGDGNYTISGLPAGDYWVVVWGDQGGWITEFFEETTFQDEAEILIINPGDEIGGINFTMELGGSITGTVYDSDSNTLGGIGVDIEEGGYGTCTDENGFYSVENLPVGSTVNLVAGWNFCGEHPYGEQIQFDILVPSEGIDFYLEMQYNPTLHVVPAYPEVHGHGWRSDSVVTIHVDNDDDIDNGFLYSESKLVTDEPTWCGEPCFDLSDLTELPMGILPGYVVSMEDSDASVVVHTTSLVWTGSDIDTEKVFGTADAGTWVEVTIQGPVWAQRWVQADLSGYWQADFSVPGLEDFEQDLADLDQGYHGRAIQFDSDVPDNGTLAYWHTPQYTIIAFIDHEWVMSSGWSIGDSITLNIVDQDDPGDGILYTADQIAWENPAEPGVGYVEFFGWEPLDLNSGMLVILTDGTTADTLLVEPLSVESFDEELGRVGGTAPPNREVGVGVQQLSGDFWILVLSDESGNWTADFGSGIFMDVFDIHAMVWDLDGDATQANYEFPEPE